MNEETIIDQQVNSGNRQQKKAEKQPAEKANAKPSAQTKSDTGKKKFFGAAGIAGAVGVAAGILTPKQAFAQMSEIDNGEVANAEEIVENDAPTPTGHHTGHDMDVATGVDDSMSFSEAFAAARHEVGAGGLFVWHGNTYGTYYENEWNAMSAEDRDQYWADVYHTTDHINHEINDPVDPEPPADPEPPTEPIDPGDPGEEPGEHGGEEVPSDPPGGWDGSEEPVEEPNENPGEDPNENPGEDPEPTVNLDPEDGTLYVNEEDILAEIDTDGDGMIDTTIVDVNGNDIPDLIIDTDGDGAPDTLAVDVNVGEVHDINEVVVLNDIDTNEPILDPNDPLIDPDPLTEPYSEVDPLDDDPSAYEDPAILDDNPDVDLLSDNTIDPDIPIDNNSDVSEFV